MDEPEKRIPFLGIEYKEELFKNDLYFVIREKGFEYCKKIYFHLLNKEIESQDKKIIEELDGVLGELRNLIPKVVWYIQTWL